MGIIDFVRERHHKGGKAPHMYGYNTETKVNSVDLYSVDSDGSGGYYAVYDAEEDAVSPYDE